MDITEKVCTVCKTMKHLTEFRKYSGRSRGGVRPLCKDCQREYEKKWRSSSKEYMAAQRQKRRDADKVYRQEWMCRNRASYLVSECRRRCTKKGIPFNLDQHVQELEKRIAAGVCEVSGYPLNNTPSTGRTFNTPSLDMINPKGGYLYENVRIVAFAVNAALGDWGEQNFKQIMKMWMAK